MTGLAGAVLTAFLAGAFADSFHYLLSQRALLFPSRNKTKLTEATKQRNTYVLHLFSLGVRWSQMAKRSLTYREQAARARRLAHAIPEDEASKKLLTLAEQYEALANEEDAEDNPEDTLH
jgi:hypothetical protein